MATSSRFFFICPEFSMLALRMDFSLASWLVCFWLSVCFCICLWYALDFACIVQHLPAANRMVRVWHAFATVPGGVVVWVAALMRVLSAVLVVYRVLALEVRCWLPTSGGYIWEVASFALCCSCLLIAPPAWILFLSLWLCALFVCCYICSLTLFWFLFLFSWDMADIVLDSSAADTACKYSNG